MPVGQVSQIELPDGSWTARVTMLVNGSVHLPANAVARLHQSSLLGEKYVQLAAPADGSGAGTLRDGAEIPLTRTHCNPEVEEVLGALSLLLNGGGIGQLRTITGELNDALGGNEPEIKALLKNIDTLMSDLDGHRADITAAIDGLSRFSGTLAQRDQQIGTILDDLGPGLRVLEQQRGQLVTMLQSLDTLCVARLLADGPIVLFFYPGAMTTGCTREACHFRDTAAEFAAAGVGRVGISRDTVAKQKEFADQNSFDYPLLSDEDGTVAGLFGVARNGLLSKFTPVKRWSFAIGADRRVIKVIRSETNMNVHADEALQAFL